MKLLLICFAFDTLQYRVLRCAAEIAEAVYVLGPASARRLASSRFCTRFIPATSLGTSSDLDRSREETDAVASAHGVDLVLPGDGRAVRLLSQLQPMRARIYPVPDHRTFDLLNDKWSFGELCKSLDIRHPPPRLFRDGDALCQELARGGLRLPIVIKPTNLSGGRGFHSIRSASDVPRARQLTYSPILAQPYIEGTDICLSAFCRGGEILTSVVYRRQRGNCVFTTNAEFLDLAGRVLCHVDYDGVANFDARLDRSGRIHMIECNPRFWFTIDMALLAGLNFVGLGSAARVSRELPAASMNAVFRSNRSLLQILCRRPWALARTDLRTFKYRLRDPIPPLYELLDQFRGHIPQG